MSGLSRAQETALVHEQTAARQLLAHGVTLVTTSKYFDPVLDPLFTCWSIGLEKLLKLGLGLLDIHRGDAWKLRKTHDLIVLSDELFEYLDGWASTRSAYLVDVVGKVSTDAMWRPLLTGLSEYGQMGRFRHLDNIGGHQNSMSSVEKSWQAIEGAANKDPQIAPHWEAFDFRDAAGADAMHAAIGRVVARPIVNSWQAITRTARHGAFGDYGIRFGADAEPENAIPKIDPRTFP